MVYKTKVLPLSKIGVENLKEFFEYYLSLDFEMFQECITDIARSARQHQEEANFITVIHQSLLLGFKKMEGQVQTVLKNLELQKKRIRK